MENLKDQRLSLFKSGLRLIPFLALGAIVFSLNSATHLNYLLRGYLVLVECQIGIVLLYFLIARIVKRRKRKQDLVVDN